MLKMIDKYSQPKHAHFNGIYKLPVHYARTCPKIYEKILVHKVKQSAWLCILWTWN